MGCRIIRFMQLWFECLIHYFSICCHNLHETINDMIGPWITIKKYNLKGIQTTYWDPIPSRKLVLNNAIHICWPKIEIDLVNKAYESPTFVYNKEMDTVVSKVFRSMEVEKDNVPHNSWNRWRHHEFQSIEVSFGHNYNMTLFSHSCNVLMIMDIV